MTAVGSFRIHITLNPLPPREEERDTQSLRSGKERRHLGFPSGLLLDLCGMFSEPLSPRLALTRSSLSVDQPLPHPGVSASVTAPDSPSTSHLPPDQTHVLAVSRHPRCCEDCLPDSPDGFSLPTPAFPAPPCCPGTLSTVADRRRCVNASPPSPRAWPRRTRTRPRSTCGPRGSQWKEAPHGSDPLWLPTVASLPHVSTPLLGSPGSLSGKPLALKSLSTSLLPGSLKEDRSSVPWARHSQPELWDVHLTLRLFWGGRGDLGAAAVVSRCCPSFGRSFSGQ